MTVTDAYQQPLYYSNIKQAFLFLCALTFILCLILCVGVGGCTSVCIFLKHLLCKVQSLQRPVTSESLTP